MGDPGPPRNRDQDIPTRTGDDMGQHEPFAPRSGPERNQRPVPDEEQYEREREKKRPDEERAPVRD
jgi:hypothetical protein